MSRDIPLASARKFRLFGCACSWLNDVCEADIDKLETREESAKWDSSVWAKAWANAPAGVASRAVMVALLRQIIGNPWRSVLRTSEEIYRVEGVNVVWRLKITPTVLALARAAYEERLDAACPDRICGGRGRWADAAGDMDGCDKCGQTGRVSTGQLCPDRLSVLSDALEEAGCTDEAILRALRGEVPCVQCEFEHDGKTVRVSGTIVQLNADWSFPTRPTQTPSYWPACKHCSGSGWVKSPVPFYRGFWALDCILGLS